MKALLVIDVQKKYMEKYGDELISKMNERIRQADGLTICSSYVICKQKASAFSNKKLLPMLREHGVEHISLIGVQNRNRFEQKKEKFTSQGIATIISIVLITTFIAARGPVKRIYSVSIVENISAQ